MTVSEEKTRRDRTTNEDKDGLLSIMDREHHT